MSSSIGQKFMAVNYLLSFVLFRCLEMGSACFGSHADAAAPAVAKLPALSACVAPADYLVAG